MESLARTVVAVAAALLFSLGRQRGAGATSADDLLRHQRRPRARAPISAASRAPTAIASSSRRPPAPAARPGTPISARRRRRQAAVNARDRIGKGPWQNAKGAVVAKDVAELHGDQQPDQADRAQREGRGDQRPRRHAEPARHPDRLAAGRHAPSRPATTAPAATGRAARRARRWSAIIDRRACDDAPSKSWNSSHPSRGPDGGCSQADLKSTGGDGLFYCFAAN